MASREQVKGNRQTANKKGRPKSARGKEVAELPAVRHGPRAEHVVLPCDDREEFEALVRDLQEDWRPLGTRQRLVFDEIVDGRWLLQRVRNTRNARIKKEYWAIDPNSAPEEEIEPRYVDPYSPWKFQQLRKKLIKQLKELRDLDKIKNDLDKIDYDSFDIHQNEILNEDNIWTAPANSLTVLAVSVRRGLKDLEVLSRLETEIVRRLRDAERELERLQANRRALVSQLLE